ncbi:MAG: Rpn family recombination-promoting nuclease/putative transposase [Oliverpabstia sp.]|nr:Rpn family recombination-promoting nuclease/putative transposase [Oliverpabstia sp.]
MKKRKTLQDLTIKDNFLFGAVMRVEENCKGFLEMVLGFPIARVVVSKEKSIIYHPEYKGVRLDIYAEDDNHTHYNVEMQVRKKKSLGKRSRYYHSQMVMEYLESGEEYETIPDTFVIFVCDFDPFGQGLYCYTFRNECQEDRKVKLEDGSSTIFLNTQGRNESEVPEGLVRFLKFVTADLEESEGDFQDELVRKFQETIRRIKTDRQMGERYMIFEEMLKEEKQEGRLEAKKEDIFELLEELGEIPKELQEKIGKLEDITKLKILLKMAAKADSISAFEEETEEYFNSEK